MFNVVLNVACIVVLWAVHALRAESLRAEM